MQENKDYIMFVLGYDLLQNHFSNSIESECDLVYEKCSKIADDFLSSEYNSNNKGLYDCITDYIKSKRYINFLNSLEENHIKTLEGWHKSKVKTFYDFCKPGDIVDQNIVDYFSNVLPPIIARREFVQAGGIFDDSIDKEDNLLKPTYITFEKEDGKWVYKGNCFIGKNEDMTYADSNFINPINKEFKRIGYIEDSIVDRYNELKEKLNWKLNLNQNVFSRVLDKIKEDDELKMILDETIGFAIAEVKEEILKCEEKEASEI